MSDKLVQFDNETAAGAINVVTFGGFSVAYNGREISFGQQNESQIVHLLQLLLHCRDKGVTRDLAKAELFRDREIDDVSHSIRNIIYNPRKKMREYDLPESQFVVKRSGNYYWADDIPVAEDAAAFEESFNEAMAEEDPDRKLELLIRTIYLYKGKFLADNEGSAWAASEAKRYKDLFARSVNAAAELMRKARRYDLMQEIGDYASEVDPFAEWEIITLEALAGLGRFDRTESFYRATIDAYSNEFGGKTSSYVREFINRIGLRLLIRHESLEEIKNKLKGDSDHENTGYYCSLPVFQEIYRITERIMEYSGDRIFIMLCTIVDGKGKPMNGGTRLEELSARLKDAILNSVRYSDTVTRYGKGQFLVLMIDTTKEGYETVEKRITSKFMKNGQRTGVSYSVSNVIVPAFSEELNII
jgi:two-component SAPR family response regulator